MNKKILVVGLSGESVFINVDHINKPGETIEGLSKHTEPGGKGYNQAIALGKLGCDVSFITALGCDEYSKECIRVLKEHNVKPLPIYKNINGSYAVIVVDKTGDNNVIVYKGASELITYDDIINNYKKQIDEADIILLQLEYNKDLTTNLINYLYDKKKTIVLNPAPHNYLDNSILNKVDYLTPNEFELSLIDYDKLSKPLIICTKGSKGVKIINTGKEINAFNVKVVDTTGAGDTFNAGLVFAIGLDKKLEDAVTFANACSALEVTKKGVIEAVPTYKEVINFLKGDK